jgi:ribonuclease HI
MYVEDFMGEPVAEKSLAAGIYCSSYTGECVGMLEAVRWTSTEQLKYEEPLNVLVCTDSRSLADSMRKNNWKDHDHWLKQIKDEIYDSTAEITVLWIPSHCKVEGNDKADDLANLGSKMDQSGTPVIHKIVKAKIKKKNWEVEHPRAKDIYGKRRGPKTDVERTWPRSVHTHYARLRTGHAQELKKYRCEFLQLEDDAWCPEIECEEEESIEHVLCRCAGTAEARAREWSGEVKAEMLVEEPEVCRKILSVRYGQLRLPVKARPANQLESASRSSNGLVGTQRVVWALRSLPLSRRVPRPSC